MSQRAMKYLHDKRIVYRRYSPDQATQEFDWGWYYAEGTHGYYSLFRSNAKINTYKSLKWHLLTLWYLNPNMDYNQFKEVTKITSQVSAGSLLSTSNFSTFNVSDIPTANRFRAVEVYVNGVLQESGSNAQVTANPPTCDYFLDDSTASAADLKFGFDIEIDDNVVVMARYAENVTQTPQDLTQIVDDDGDTKIQVEESGDEDIIRFDTNGNERMIIRNDGRVGIGVSTGLPNVALTLDGSGIASSVGDLALDSKMTHKGDSDTFLEFPSADQINIEAGGQNMIRMVEDSPNNRVLILSGGAGSDSNEDSYTDLNFFVSGSIGSMGSSTRGTSVFGGDMHVSGTLSYEDYMIISVSADNTDLATGAGQASFRAPFPMSLPRVPRASLTTAGTGGSTVDIHVNGTTIMNTNKLTFDANESTTTTAATAVAARCHGHPSAAQSTLPTSGQR